VCHGSLNRVAILRPYRWHERALFPSPCLGV
jgi:hypothetical protein